MARQNKTNPFSPNSVSVCVDVLAIVLCGSSVNASNWKIGFDVSVRMYVTQNGPPFVQKPSCNAEAQCFDDRIEW